MINRNDPNEILKINEIMENEKIKIEEEQFIFKSSISYFSKDIKKNNMLNKNRLITRVKNLLN